MMSPVYRARAVQPGTAMTAHGDQVRRHCGAGPFFASGAPSDHRPGDADPALQQIYLRVTQPTANSEEAGISLFHRFRGKSLLMFAAARFRLGETTTLRAKAARSKLDPWVS